MMGNTKRQLVFALATNVALTFADATLAQSNAAPSAPPPNTASPMAPTATPPAIGPTAIGSSGAPPAAATALPPSDPSASAPNLPSVAPPSASTPSPPKVVSGTCVEHIPEGKVRPTLSERFPERGLSGHRATLQVTIEHGQGERVLPGALEIQTDSDAAKAIAGAGFVFPDFKGPARPRVRANTASDGSARSTVEIHVVPLPKEPGRHELVLPPLPVAMARASGEVITLCTEPHTITIEDPVANKPDASPKPNPKPLRQRELWEALRNISYGAAIGLVVAALLALLYRWWARRPKAAPPPPPPRPAWEIAILALHDIRHARLVEQGRLEDHVDRVEDTLRQYLGARFGFDGLESTSEEVLAELHKRPEASSIDSAVAAFLQQTDLIKFANVAPTEDQCHELLDQAERIVVQSTPDQSTARHETTRDGEVEA